MTGALAPPVLVLGGLIDAIGLPGSLAVLATTLLALYHFRSVLQVFATMGMVMRVGAVFVALFVLVLTGLVPGVEGSIDIAVDTLVGTLTEIVDLLVAIWEVVA